MFLGHTRADVRDIYAVKEGSLCQVDAGEERRRARRLQESIGIEFLPEREHEEPRFSA